jgi:peptidoglycan/LPS O-acetylase OafA/YrhL
MKYSSVRCRVKVGLERWREPRLHYPLGYKPSLDGLRALAILSVMLFHFGATGFAWGYVGDDIFFVISGYLITAILLYEYARNGRISFRSFYYRRALRLLPALAVPCLVFFGLSCTILKNPKQAAQEVAVVIFYIANWTRAFEAGVPKALGHTWSLSVEEQFYMVWPGILLVTLTVRPFRQFACCAVLTLVAVVILWRAHLTAAGAAVDRLYFGTDTRADAFLIGAAVALALSVPRVASHVAAPARYLWVPAAVVVVAVPAVFPWFDRHMFYGGYSVVALAAAIIVAAALYDGLLARALGNRVLVWIGRRSYGLYLWHYPIMLLCLLHFHVPDGVRLTLLAGTGAFVAAALSYRFVELPALQLRYVKPPPIRAAQLTDEASGLIPPQPADSL